MGKHGPVSPSTRVSSRRRTLFEGGRRVRYGGDGVVVFIGSVFHFSRFITPGSHAKAGVSRSGVGGVYHFTDG